MGQDTRRSGDMFVAAITAGATSMGADVHPVGDRARRPALAFLAARRRLRGRDHGLGVAQPGRGQRAQGARPARPQAGRRRRGRARGRGPARRRAAGRAARGDRAGRRRAASSSRATSRTAWRSRGPSTRAACTSCSTRPTGRRTAWRPRSSARPGARVTVIHDAPDGDNINRASGATAPASLADAVRAAGADIGFALDGDADRCVAVDADGQPRGRRPGPRHPRARAARRAARSTTASLVVSVLSNGGLQAAVEAAGGPHRPDPGRGQAHPRRDAGLGRRPRRREERPRDHPRAHHVGRRDRDRARAAAGHDGARAPGSPSSPTRGARSCPSSSARSGSATATSGRPTTSSGASIADAERRLAPHGRVLVRPSGTEPVLRVMVEGPRRRRSSPSSPTPSRRSQATDYTSQPRRGRELEPKENPQAHVRHRRLHRSPRGGPDPDRGAPPPRVPRLRLGRASRSSTSRATCSSRRRRASSPTSRPRSRTGRRTRPSGSRTPAGRPTGGRTTSTPIRTRTARATSR